MMSKVTFVLSVTLVALLATSVLTDEAPYPAQQETSGSSNSGRNPQYPWPTAQAPAHQSTEEGYRVQAQNGYEGYLVPTYMTAQQAGGYPTELLPIFGGVGVAWAAVAWVVSHAVAIGLGIILAIGVCKLTPLCSVGWLGSHVDELRGFASSERVSRAADMLTQALKKFGNQGGVEEADVKNEEAKKDEEKKE